MEYNTEKKENPNVPSYNPENLYPQPPPYYDPSVHVDQAYQYGPNVVHGGPNMAYTGPTTFQPGPTTFQTGHTMVQPGPTMIQPGFTVYPATGTTVVTTRPVAVSPAVGVKPATITCPSCNHQIITRVEFTSSMGTHLVAGLICIFMCWPCCLIPYCVDSCKSAEHYCPNCNAFINTYRR